MGKNVALVLGSGGARGLAHIGAIEALEERGYTITSIAGCSMGSIIAGMYAAGQLKEAKEWFLSVDKQLILRMMDINLLSVNSLVKGQRIIEELEKVVPDRPIESLNIPCSIVATDMIHSDEVVFQKGSLFEAVRASISIPSPYREANACSSTAVSSIRFRCMWSPARKATYWSLPTSAEKTPCPLKKHTNRLILTAKSRISRKAESLFRIRGSARFA